MWHRWVLGVCVLAMLGCSKPSPSLVGTWSFDRAREGEDTATQFNADGTYKFWFRAPNGRHPVNVSSTGTWKLASDQLNKTELETIMTSGKVIRLPSPHPYAETLRWLSPDRIELSEPQGPETYTRRSSG